MELQEIQDNIRSRRNKIFLQMEEVRRLRIQQRLKSAELGIVNDEQENELPDFPSFIPFLPPLNSSNLKVYYATCFTLIAGVMLFGGLLAPTFDVIDLFLRISGQVDPIVASFTGGAVGVISALMVVEINNVKQQEDKKCKYCLGTGYLACARCASTGSVDPVSTLNEVDRPLSPPKSERCSNCSGSGKVMCPTCLCTGMAMASEHDPRIDPFD
ncbi:chaperone protein dnaJ-related [Striga asiatica]|uniref:Chaperone protein dnaJ-related n=1 Tax=Striga asiatica TaxID=4170 RepID=A0A5A7P9N9_STRAF|nr:chaperone protein dnaJ-related [Striga asiatica]